MEEMLNRLEQDIILLNGVGYDSDEDLIDALLNASDILNMCLAPEDNEKAEIVFDKAKAEILRRMQSR